MRPATWRPRPQRVNQPVPYLLTDAGRAALDRWPANRIEHEPASRCDGRRCRCYEWRAR